MAQSPFYYKIGNDPALLLDYACAGNEMRRTKRVSSFHGDDAETTRVASFGRAASATAGGRALRIAPQLPRRNSSGAENTNDQRCKEH